MLPETHRGRAVLLTADKLAEAVGCDDATASRWAAPLSLACAHYEIDTPKRLAPFLAQIGHESASLGRVVENLNYGAQGLRNTWPGRFPDVATAAQYARQPEKIANRVYGGRLGNRPEEAGDGWRYRGRGLIQITGRSNYAAMRDLLREDFPDAPNFVDEPDAMTEPKWAALSAAAYWADHDLNDLADRGAFEQITRRINGGSIGLADRQSRLLRAKRVFA